MGLFDNRPTEIDGYDLQAEKDRYAFEDEIVGKHSLNRGTVGVEITGPMEQSTHQGAREAHESELFKTTHPVPGFVLEMGYPAVGPFVMCKAGIYFDCMLGVAQKIIGERHPAFEEAVKNIESYQLWLRRELNQDDYFDLAEGVTEIRLPQDLAAIANRNAERAFPGVGGFKTFLSNSGTESVEAGLKMAFLVAWRKLEAKVGSDVIESLMGAMGISKREDMPPDASGETLWWDYPLFIMGCEKAFHGRTLGSLTVTSSKRAHHYGYPKIRGVRHIPFNCDPAVLDDLVDERDLPEILEDEGGIRAVLNQGRIPKDLIVGFIAEPMQGEGGYVPGDPAFFKGVAERMKRWGALMMVDEVQTWGRTGKLFATEHLGIEPDIICCSKAAVVGITLARADFEQYLHKGWHSNTFGGGKLFDINIAHAVWDTILNERSELFEGRNLIENTHIKGQYLSWHLDQISKAYPEVLIDHSGFGFMVGISVANRDAFVDVAWKKGLKLLGCGKAGEVARIRLLFLTDTTTREIEVFADLLAEVCRELSESS